MTQRITEFKGKYNFLSNFHPAPVELDGVTYPSVENAYQASKYQKGVGRLPFRLCSAYQAKKKGQGPGCRPDWEIVKVQIMRELLAQKFAKHTTLSQSLMSTGEAHLEEGNWWGDTFWGVCKGKGSNWLGVLLMEQRSYLQFEDLI